MKTAPRILAALITVMIVAASCSSDDTSDTEAGNGTETEATTGSDTGGEASGDDDSDAEVTVEEAPAAVALSITGVSFDNATVTIHNDSDADVSLDGMWMCNRPTYVGLPAETLAAGASIDVDVTELGLQGSGGEFGLYTSSDFDSASAIVDYVQWGAAGNGRASVAVEAGLIAEGEFVDNGEADFTVE